MRVPDSSRHPRESSELNRHQVAVGYCLSICVGDAFALFYMAKIDWNLRKRANAGQRPPYSPWTRMLTEADTCRVYVLPALYAAGWNDEQIKEQLTFTPGR